MNRILIGFLVSLLASQALTACAEQPLPPHYPVSGDGPNHHIEEFCRHEFTEPDTRNDRISRLLANGYIYQGPIHENGLNCTNVLFVRPSSGGSLVGGATQAPPPNEPATPHTSGSCNFPVESIQVCQSNRGYRFAIPSPGVCATGSVPLRTIRLDCSAISRPAYHACLTASGGWHPTHSWETCGSQGYTDAPGDFVPPGRSATQGVAPDDPSVAH